MILLITPNTKRINYGLTTDDFSAIQPNLYMHLLESIFNYVNKTPCTSINMEADKITIDSLLEYIKHTNPSEIGIICTGSNPSASTMTMPGAIDLTKAIKTYFPKLPIFLWGGHPKALPERTLLESGADYIYSGKFEQLVFSAPSVDWDKIDPQKYRAHNWHCFNDLSSRTPYGVIWTSLGCPYSCSFCCINNLFSSHSYHVRSIKEVLAEIDVLVTKHGVKNIKIMDELFVTPHPRIDEFCSGLMDRGYDLNMWCFARVDTVSPKILRKLKAVGMNWIAYGFETLSPNTLVGTSKNVDSDKYEEVIQWTRDAGINIIADFIAGFWDDDMESLDAMYAFMCKHNFEFINLYPLFAYPGTKLYADYIEQKRISVPKVWSEYSLYGKDCVPCPTKHLSSAEVLAWRDEKYVEYYRRKDYIYNIERKFGSSTKNHVLKMVSHSLERSLCSPSR